MTMEGGGDIVEVFVILLTGEVGGDEVLKIYTLRDALAGPVGRRRGENGVRGNG